ncbi:MAG: beta-lactamase family protein [Bacillus sp. (in: Bacteria)]|nr:beta-lactamase family protein [Bacillus sp. (in: firmicutes)]
METIKWREFENFVEKKMEEEKIPGVAVAVSRQGELIYEKGFGYRDLKNKVPVTPNTIFGIASVSKSFTALGILMLEERGLLSINDPVVKYLPDFNVAGVKNLEAIKVYHLLSHTTGLAPMERKESLNRLSEHITYVSSKEHELLGNPGEYFSYCNDTFILLGAIIERITGKLFRRFITEEILNPLEMYRSTYSLEEINKYTDVSIPYDINSESQLEEKQWPLLGNYEVGGGIRSSVTDLLKYGNLYINEGRIKNGNKLISGETTKKMWRTPFSIIDDHGYGYGFQVTRNYHHNTIVEHGGGQPGVSSNFGFIYEKDLVVSVLTNVSNVSAKDLWLAAVNTALNFPIEEKRIKLKARPLNIDTFQEFIGVYDCKEGSVASLYIHDKSPVVEIGGTIFSLKSGMKDMLIIETTDSPLQFFRKGGKVWAMLLGTRMLIKRS